MKCVRTTSPEPVIEYVVETLSQHLRRGERVAWLLSGGSAIALEVSIAQELLSYDTSKLTVALIDERYGPPGHKDENYSQLIEAGFPLQISRVLTGDAPENTAKAFGRFIEGTLEKTDLSLGIFGIGADGHTAGIKPHSPAVFSNEVATYYVWGDYKRITLTASTIKKINEVVVFAMGAEKASTLNMLLHTDTPIAEQPAQILKSIESSTLFTDQQL